MNILFIGQKGIPAKSGGASYDEKRVQRLASLLAHEGHTVTVLATSPYSPRHIRKWGRVAIRHVLSFHPEQSGGWLYQLLSLRSVFEMQPDVVHVHGWQAACLSRVAALLSPESTFVWTISSLPSLHPWLTRFVTWMCAGVFDAITTPSRALQYQLLTTWLIRVTYVPDGYTAPVLADIPAAHFSLRKYQYCITESHTSKELAALIRAYGKTKSKKKLVVLVPMISARLARLAKKHSFVALIEGATPRVATSLIRQAAVFIASEDMSSLENVLTAMDASRAVVAFNYSGYQEVLGTTAAFAAQGDTQELVKLLSAVMFYPHQQTIWGKRAQKRARRHFTWSRILEEYVTAYHYPAVRRVMLDSIQPAGFREMLA